MTPAQRVSPIHPPVLAMSLLVRDEASLIERNIAFHHQMGVDCFVITDNSSRDGTRRLVQTLSKRYPILLVDEPEWTMKQDEWVNRMARLAGQVFGAHWIINSDADEFWFPRSGSLKTDIGRGTGALLCHRSNMLADQETLASPGYAFHKQVLRVARPFNDGHLFQRPPYRLSPQPVTMTTLRKKVMCRLEGLERIGYGNHDVEHAGPVLESTDIHIYHYPVRTFAEFQSKVINHGTSLKNNPAIPDHIGWHVRRWYSLHEQGLLREEYHRLIPSAGQARRYLKAGVVEVDHTLCKLLDGHRTVRL